MTLQLDLTVARVQILALAAHLQGASDTLAALAAAIAEPASDPGSSSGDTTAPPTSQDTTAPAGNGPDAPIDPVSPPPPVVPVDPPVSPPVSPPPPPPPPPPATGFRVPPCGMGLEGIAPAGGKKGDGSWVDTMAEQRALDAALRNGRKSTVVVLYPGQDNPLSLIPGHGKLSLTVLREITDYGAVASPRVALATKDLIDQRKDPFDEVNRGYLDDAWKGLAGALKDAGQDKAIIGIGWEEDLGSYPWSLGKDWFGQGDKRNFVRYRAAFQRAAAIFKKALPNCSIEQCHFRGPKVELPNNVTVYVVPDDYFIPGVVEIAGVDIYDGQHDISEATADALFAQVRHDPDGRVIPMHGDAWYDWAKRIGVPMSIPEMGIRCLAPNLAAGDNPAFVRVMNARITGKWRERLVYSSWFHHGHCDSMLHPATLAGTTKSTDQFKALHAR